MSTTPVQIPAYTKPTINSTLFGGILHGFGFGAGSSMGHKVANSVFSTNTDSEQKKTTSNSESDRMMQGGNILHDAGIINSSYSDTSVSLNIYDQCEPYYKEYEKCINSADDSSPKSYNRECDILFDKYM